jgi:nitrogenase-associated protein
MATVIFYEKPGCANNARQKKLLMDAGHRVIAKSLLVEAWTSERLLTFFGKHAVADWFNRAAPKVKSGEVIPEQLSAQAALTMMIAEPLLIRRPLIASGDRFEVGFEPDLINRWLGLSKMTTGDLETCAQQHVEKHCVSKG